MTGIKFFVASQWLFIFSENRASNSSWVVFSQGLYENAPIVLIKLTGTLSCFFNWVNSSEYPFWLLRSPMKNEVEFIWEEFSLLWSWSCDDWELQQAVISCPWSNKWKTNCSPSAPALPATTMVGLLGFNNDYLSWAIVEWLRFEGTLN